MIIKRSVACGTCVAVFGPKKLALFEEAAPFELLHLPFDEFFFVHYSQTDGADKPDNEQCTT